MKKALAGISTAALALSFVTVAHAQTETAVDDNSGDIVVTATRKNRAEALQEVPVSVSAFNAETVEKLQAQDLTDLGRLSPGARLEGNGTFPAAANFFIRGVGVNTTNPSDDPTVGVFSDGMYLGVNIGALTDIFDIESIEILRGPQGTLFGRNVTGGAVLVRSRRPSGDFGVRGSLTLGSFDQLEAKVAIEGAIVPDMLNAKLAVMAKDRDGYFSNAAMPDNRIAASDSIVVRPMLELTPSDDLTLTLIGEIGRRDDDGTPTKLLIDKLDLAPPVPTGKFDLTSDFATHTDTDWNQVVLEGVYDTGPGKLTATLSYRDVAVDNEAEIDGSAATLFHFLDPAGLRQDQRTAEIIYATQIGDNFDLSVGANYFDQDVDYKEYRQLLTSIFQAGRGKLAHSAKGVFAQADWTFVPNLTLTLGGRYTIEKKHAQVATIGTCDAAFLNCPFTFDDSQTWKDFSPKVGLRYLPSRDLNLYASWTRGFRSGGYNLRNSVGPAGPYDPENVDAYEIGLKSRLLDRMVTFNVAAYRNDFSDLQRQTLDEQARQRILNAANARIQGLEFELGINVSGFSLSGTAAYTDAKYKSFLGLDLTGDGVPDPELARQLKFNRVPKWTYAITGEYSTDLNDDYKLSLIASYDHTGDRAGSDTNTFFLDSYGLLNASLRVATVDDRYSLTIFGKNLTNELYASTGVDVSFFRSVYIGPPQRWGVEFGFKY